MRIVHVYNELDPQNGGPPHVIVGLVAGQQALGHEVVLISEDPQDSPAVDAFLNAHLSTIPRRYSVRPRLFVDALSRAAFMRGLKGADIVHIHGIWPVVSMMASRICRELGIPWICAPHGSLHHGALMEKRLKKLVGMWTLGYRGYIRDAAALHMLNSHEAEGARHPGYVGVTLPECVRVIPNGVFPEEFSTPSTPGRFRAAVPDLGDDPYILFLSRLHPGKGCDLLGEAFVKVQAQYPEIRLVLIGQDQGGLQLLMRPVERAGLADRVHVIGPVYDQRKHAAYVDAAVYCLPSLHEGFSMAITEALAWGRPVVATRTCHFPELSEHDCGVEVEPNAHDLAEGLCTVLADKERAREMGERGRALVLERYTWPYIAERTLELYAEILERDE